MAIVKNIPENNARLWKVKHLIKVDGIVFPYGEPTENDTDHSFLKQNGECIVTKQISVPSDRLEATEKFIKKPERMDKEFLSKDSLSKWVKAW